MKFIHANKKYFIFDLKSNRLAIIGNRNEGKWKNINKLELQPWTPTKVWLKNVEIELILIKQVFINKDKSTGVRYLVSNDLSLSAEAFSDTYKKRWSVEEYHKSFKQNSAMSLSPTRTVKTQCAHVFASLIGYVKFERYKFSTKLNHFALKGKLYTAAVKHAFKELEKIKSQNEIFEEMHIAA